MSTSFVALAPMIALWTRTMGLFVTAPLVSDVPGRVRIGAAATLAVVLSPLRPALTFEALPAALPLELCFGLVAGFICRMTLAGVEAGGQLLGLQLELGFAGSYDVQAREEALPTRRLAFALAGLAFLSSGGLESMLRALLTAPSLDARTLTALLGSAMRAAAQVLPVALRLAAPLLVAAVVANLALALASRAAPALNMFSVTLAAVLVVGASVLWVTVPALGGDLIVIGRRAGEALQLALHGGRS